MIGGIPGCTKVGGVVYDMSTQSRLAVVFTARPARFRPILTTVLVLILLVIFWVSLEVYFALTAQPNPVIDYGEQLEALVVEAQEGREGEDAWPVLMEAIELMRTAESDAYDTDGAFQEREILVQYDVIFDYDRYIEDIEDHSYSVDADKRDLELQHRLTLEALARFDETGVTSRLDEVASSGVGVMPVPDSRNEMLIGILLPSLGEQRNLARALRARMYLAAEDSDWQTYTDSFEYMLAIGRLTGEQPFLIQRLVGIAIRALAVGAVTEDLTSGRIDPSALPGLVEAYERQSPMAPIEFALRSELLWELDAVQWTHTKRGRLILSEGGKLDWSGTSRPKIVNVASIVYPKQRETEQWFRDFHEEGIARSRLTPAERRHQPQDPKWDVFSWNMYLQELLVPALGSTLRGDDQSRLTELGLVTMLAIERYRADEGALPASLESLVPAYLDDLPADMHSIESAPLRYVVLDEPDEVGRDYLLYSIGADEEDDAGQPEEQNIFNALRPGYEGSDFVLNRVSDE